MSETHHCIGHVLTPYGDATILVGRYLTGTAVGGAIAVQLVEDGDATQPLATFSINLLYYSAALSDDEFCVKCWSETEVLVAPMFATGLFEDTGKRAPCGYIAAPVWRIKDPTHVPPAPVRRAGSDRTAAVVSVR